MLIKILLIILVVLVALGLFLDWKNRFRIQVRVDEQRNRETFNENPKARKLFLKNEVQLDALTNGDFLTNYRVIQEYGDDKNHIFLEKISSVSVHFKNKPLILTLGIIALMGTIFAFISDFDGALAFVSFLVALFLFIAYFASRKYVISINPDGGKPIDIMVKGLSNSRISEYIFNIQEAKLDRCAYLGCFVDIPNG